MEATDPNGTGNAVQNTTSTKISQTWLASHTGPMERSMLKWMRRPHASSPAVTSQTPVPKSAPPRTA